MSRKTHKTSVGGQALIEGVMMQGPRGMATAVRKPDGEILTEYHTIKLLPNKNKFFNIFGKKFPSRHQRFAMQQWYCGF